MYFSKGTKQKEREEKNLRSKVISELVTDILFTVSIVTLEEYLFDVKCKMEIQSVTK